jgi:hypothetical protein
MAATIPDEFLDRMSEKVRMLSDSALARVYAARR